MTGLYILIFVAAAAVLAALWFITTMNAFARLAVKVEESDSGIGVYILKKRFVVATGILALYLLFVF